MEGPRTSLDHGMPKDLSTLEAVRAYRVMYAGLNGDVSADNSYASAFDRVGVRLNIVEPKAIARKIPAGGRKENGRVGGRFLIGSC